MDFLIATIVDAVSISVLNRNNLAQGDSPAQTFADDEKLGGINLGKSCISARHAA
jgi:hypothetical protein